MTEYIIDWDTGLVIDTFSKNNLRDEIVRCRDCRHMRTIDLSVYYGEHKHDLDICTRVNGVQLNAEPNGFCAWASRKEVEE